MPNSKEQLSTIDLNAQPEYNILDLRVEEGEPNKRHRLVVTFKNKSMRSTIMRPTIKGKPISFQIESIEVKGNSEKAATSTYSLPKFYVDSDANPVSFENAANIIDATLSNTFTTTWADPKLKAAFKKLWDTSKLVKGYNNEN